MLPSKVYDVLKFILQLGLPALAALMFGIASVWGFDWGDKVVGTISVIEVALGILLGISSKKFYENEDKENQDGSDDKK